MNALQRLLSNTFLAFSSEIIVKLSSALLFILIARQIGPEEAGVFNLAVTYLVIIFALSDWGLQELLIREVAPRRNQSAHYFINYLAMRLLLSAVTYALLLLLLRFSLPHTDYATTVIRVLTLALFPEAIFGLCRALFIAHEQFLIPTLAATFNSGFKLAAGLWLLLQGGDAATMAWAMPVGSTLSLLIFLPLVGRLVRTIPQISPASLALQFSLNQLRYAPGFIIIGIFLTLDFQLDTLLISFFLSESDLGWYGAAQTIMLAFWMMPLAIRNAIYPLMARYVHHEPEKLALLYHKANRYLLIAGLPVAAGIALLAEPIIILVFGESFSPARPALQWMIWAVVFAFLNVPNARLMLVHNRQSHAGWMTGISMLINLSLNLYLIPLYGIVGAAVARTVSTGALFAGLYLYVQTRLLRDSIVPLIWRPLLATAVMLSAVWLLKDTLFLWAGVAGIIVYLATALLLQAIPLEDQELLRSRLSPRR
jgi:O-antigen/teichoic acid export membrane protein